jgi:DNA-binding LacI/PurR family transcriptional regulator/DNA-binding transcriptional regulator YhcF (GntR family)
MSPRSADRSTGGGASPAAALARRIREAGLRAGEPLPSIRALAARFGAGRGAVYGAIQRLAREGWLQRKPWGRGYVRAGAGYHEREARLPQARGPDARIADYIKSAILSGARDPGESIDSIKELRNRFGCAYAPVSRGLRRLERQGLIERSGRGYRVAPSGYFRQGGATAVYFFGPPTSLRPELPATAELVAPLEREIQMLGWGPIGYYIDPDPSPGAAPPPSSIAAIIAVKREFPDRWERLLSHYRNIPLVTFDAWETLSWDRAAFARHHAYRAIVPDNRRAGAAMARLFRESGHRRLAFFSHLPRPRADSAAHRWLLARMAGIEEFLGEPGAAGLWDRVIVDAATASSAPPARSRAWWSVRADPLFRRYCDPTVHKTGLHAVERLISLSAIASALRPDFEAALRRATATFWLCVNDDAAAAAVHFLRERGVRVGRDIAVAGFDNSHLAFAQGITSYDLGIDRAGIMAARCLANPNLALSDPDGFIRLPGRVTPRDSTGVGRAV